MFMGSVKAFAVENQCSLTVKISNSDNATANSGLNIGVCQIASFNGDSYKLTDEFANSGISVDNLLDNLNSDHCAEIYRYIINQGIPYKKKATDSDGLAVYSQLNKGVYLVFCEQSQQITFRPYAVILPSVANGIINYDVISEPKTITAEKNVKDIHVEILWDDNDNYIGIRPEFVIVTLIKDGVPYMTATLNEECNWEYTFENLPADSTYVVVADKIDFYELSYEGSEDSGFTIINTLISDSPIIDFVKTGINSGAIPIAFLVLISALVLILLSRKRIKK
ncbi:Cna B-type domain-containing protein [Ruminococcus sp. zg-921]|nr:Cna B-type domain-containing protein [Ruminococcus sp. zg-921]